MTPQVATELRLRLILLGADLWIFFSRLPHEDYDIETLRSLMREILALTDLCEEDLA